MCREEDCGHCAPCWEGREATGMGRPKQGGLPLSSRPPWRTWNGWQWGVGVKSLGVTRNRSVFLLYIFSYHPHVCVCRHTYILICVSVCVCQGNACRGQRTTLGVGSHLSPCWRQCLLFATGQRAPSMSQLLSCPILPQEC